MNDEHTVHFASRDGLPLNGTWQAASDDVAACALLIHGIDSEQHESGFYTDIARALAASNVASLRFDWRTQGANSLPLVEMSLTGIVNDIHAAWRLLHEQRGCEGKRLVVIAASFGGGPAIVWAKDNADPAGVNCTILLAPVLDYTYDLFRHHGIDADGFLTPETADELQQKGHVTRGDLSLGRDLINELPGFGAGAALASFELPVTVIHGECDSDVPLEVSRRFAQMNPNARFEVWPGVDHGFVQPGTEFTDPVNDDTHAAVVARVHEIVINALGIRS